MIEVRNISKSYDNRPAVADVSFTIQPGEVVGLLGPNGAGKTTTLNMLTGVLVPDQGDVLIDGKSMSVDGASLKVDIGYLPEDNPLYHPLLVSESLTFAAQLKGLSPMTFKERLDRVVSVTGIASIYNQSIDSLSKGFRQRVGLAQALLSDPKILILDEPTDGLDPNQRQEIRRLITDLGQDHTILLSSHILQEVEAMCRNVIILNNGKIVAQGNLEDIARGPEDIMIFECIVVGDAKDALITTVKEKFKLETQTDGSVSIHVTPGREVELYHLLADNTSKNVYLTHLNKKSNNLEDAFRLLTQ